MTTAAQCQIKVVRGLLATGDATICLLAMQADGPKTIANMDEDAGISTFLRTGEHASLFIESKS